MPPNLKSAPPGAEGLVSDLAPPKLNPPVGAAAGVALGSEKENGGGAGAAAGVEAAGLGP